MKKLMHFLRLVSLLSLWALWALCVPCSTGLATEASSLEWLQREFKGYAGTRLVFQRSQLSPGNYYDHMPELAEERMLQAARICLTEVKKYPPGYLGQIHLKTIGVFATCASKSNDGFHPYVAELGGYRYYGISNGADGIAAAYYSDRQLPLTFHHEIFHQVQATRRGVVDAARHADADNLRYRQAIAGERPYPSPPINAADLAALRQISQGRVLRGAVSEYAAKNENEDQAETARYFMTTLADSLVQVVDQPALPGSQRILDVLERYRAAGVPGPGVDWFVDVALGRVRHEPREKSASRAAVTHLNAYLDNVDKAIADPETRAAIRRVQPACVRLPRASGCCISPKGAILTAAHVAIQKGETLAVVFPDGARYTAACTAIDHHLDVAVLQINGVDDLPFAPLASAVPGTGTWVCAIGQPGSTSPSGRATGYQPFHVSTGHIRGFRGDDRLAFQGLLGGVKHDAWTYWGHSGCPLFNDRGQIVAMHNSWDSQTRMRHGVTYEAIVHCRRKAGVDFSIAQ